MLHFFENEDIQNYMTSYMLTMEQIIDYYGHSINQMYHFSKNPNIENFLALQRLATTSWHGSELDVKPTILYYYLIKRGGLAYSYENIEENNKKIVHYEKGHVFYLENYQCDNNSLLAHFLKVDVASPIFSKDTLQSLSKSREMYNLLHDYKFIEAFFLLLSSYPNTMYQYFENVFDVVAPHGFNFNDVLKNNPKSIFPSVAKVAQNYSVYRGHKDTMLEDNKHLFGR